MKIRHDMHTHTVWSHGKNTIEEMVQQARKIGLAAITISDHGRSHPLFGVRKGNFIKMRKEIDGLNKKYPDIDITLSVEANIIGAQGQIDVQEEELSHCHWISAGYHYGYIPASLGDVFRFAIPNYLARILPFLRKYVIAMNTRTYVMMMEKYPIRLITHPGNKIPIDIDQVAAAAAKHNVLLEINPRHGHLNAQEIKIAMQHAVNFAINSDAHHREALGDMRNTPALVRAAGLPIERIVNVSKGESL